jgi:hypothetical protein
MSDAVERHLDKAFASLDDVPIRELQATADAIGRRSPLRDFADIFQNVADARQEGWDSTLPPLPPRAGRLPRRRGARRADLGGRGTLLGPCARRD